VQGYAYDAWLRAASIAEALGMGDKAVDLRKKAEALRVKFLESFWCPDLSVYALALDGKKKPCRVRSSNAGHTLFSGVATVEHAERMAGEMFEQHFFSGWGVRTIASSEVRYNPMSYHNGSIWPHDNALIASGLARYGYMAEAMKILEGVFSASLSMDLYRMPELFCGFKRRHGLNPTLYPLACAPQSWAAGAVFMLLQACLGISIDARKSVLRFTFPMLPLFLEEIKIKHLQIGEGVVDIFLKRYHQDVSVSVMRKEGPVEVVILK
jgi:glycogen debranching enzyme